MWYLDQFALCRSCTEPFLGGRVFGSGGGPGGGLEDERAQETASDLLCKESIVPTSLSCLMRRVKQI